MSMPANPVSATNQQNPTTQQAGHKLMVSLQSHHMLTQLLHSAVPQSSSIMLANIAKYVARSPLTAQFVLTQAHILLKGSLMSVVWHRPMC